MHAMPSTEFGQYVILNSLLHMYENHFGIFSEHN